MVADESGFAAEYVELVAAVRRQLRGLGSAQPDAGMTQAEAELVRLVRRRPGVGVRAAAEELGLAANTISTLVSRLVERKVLVRETDPHDARAARLRLTPAARRRFESWRDERLAAVTEALAALGVRDRQRLQASLPAMRRLVEALREHAAED